MSGADEPLSDDDIAAADDLIEGLERRGAARDYGRADPVRARSEFAEWRGRRLRADYSDLRSRTADANLNERAVPGYADFAAGVVVDFGRCWCLRLALPVRGPKG